MGGWRRSVAVAAVALGLVLPTSAAQAMGEPDGWALVERYPVFSVTSAWPGAIEGRPGNWHLVSLATSDDAPAHGWVEDWTCPEGEALLDAAAGYNSNCTIHPKYWELREGATPVKVTWRRTAHAVVMVGRMELVDNDTQQVVGTRYVRVVGRGFGPATTFRQESDDWLDVTVTWFDSRAWGRIAGRPLHAPGAVTIASPIREISSYVAV